MKIELREGRQPFPVCGERALGLGRWQTALVEGLGYRRYACVAVDQGQVVGVLPLALVQSRLFGKYLVGLPYVNSAGAVAEDAAVRTELVGRAIALADDLEVKHLQLRQEVEVEHPALNQAVREKVLMRLALPDTTEQLWTGLKSKVRSQVRKGKTYDLTVHWGRHELLSAFYDVFAVNMRDLGTPVFSRKLFASILDAFGDDAELCVVRTAGQPIAGAILVHDQHSTEVPSASSLRKFNKLNANMVMYWNLLERAVERGKDVFDFGRSTPGSPTYKFKKQWGALPEPSVWQYYVREGDVQDTRPDNAKFQRAIRVWQKLPVWVTRLIGPTIVRGVP